MFATPHCRRYALFLILHLFCYLGLRSEGTLQLFRSHLHELFEVMQLDHSIMTTLPDLDLQTLPYSDVDLHAPPSSRRDEDSPLEIRRSSSGTPLGTSPLFFQLEKVTGETFNEPLTTSSDKPSSAISAKRSTFS